MDMGIFLFAQLWTRNVCSWGKRLQVTGCNVLVMMSLSHINKRVDEEYPPIMFGIADDCFSETIRKHPQAAMDKDSFFKCYRWTRHIASRSKECTSWNRIHYNIIGSYPDEYRIWTSVSSNCCMQLALALHGLPQCVLHNETTSHSGSSLKARSRIYWTICNGYENLPLCAAMVKERLQLKKMSVSDRMQCFGHDVA